jgi:hypothetical protein
MRGIDPTDLLDEDEHFKLVTPDGSIDVLFSIGEMPFDQVWRNRVESTVDGVPIAFISRPDLIANKLQVGRLIDLADAEELQRLTHFEDEPLAFPDET